MNNEMIGVSRELLELALEHLTDNWSWVDELRALLAKPAAPFDDQPASDHKFYTAQLQARAAKVLGLDPENTSWFEVVGEMEKAAQPQDGPLSELEVLRAAVKELEAMRDVRVDAKLAQPLVEPVAWMALNSSGYPEKCSHTDPEGFPVFRQQPAPVAVVLPKRADAMIGSHDHQSGWNACLDEVARLNAKFR